jgi:hypothetical protein
VSFTANMTPKEVEELDKERGKKFYDEEDSVEPNNCPADRKPWLTKTPVNKSGDKDMSGADILKSFFSKSYEEDGLDIMKDQGEDSEEKIEVEIEVEKALSTRSMHVPRPHGPYDKFDIMRSATTPTTRGHSKLRGPEGVAPLIGDTMRTVEDDANITARHTMYKSCGFHGLTHRADTGCVMCNHSVSKSDSCKKCNNVMEKVKGGVSACTSCKECG